MAYKVTMPRLSDTMEEGKIIKWLKKEGDKVSKGEMLAEVETDKANLEMESFSSGILRKIVVKEGESAPLGGLLAIIGEEDEDISDVEKEAAGKTETKEKSAEEEKEEKPAVETEEKKKPEKEPVAKEKERKEAPPKKEEERIFISPLARRMAEDKGLDISGIEGSGPDGRIIKRDIEKQLSEGKVVTPEDKDKPGEYRDEPLSSVRKAIANRLIKSKAPVPHFYVTSEVDMERTIDFRESLKAIHEEIPVTFNDIIIMACAHALEKFPGVNASFRGDRIRMYQAVHIGVAVSIEDGLITPVVRNVEKKSLLEVAKETKELIARAKEKKLKPDEYSGATFTVSNMGMLDVENFSAIINPPEGAILAVSSIRKKPAVIHDEIEIRSRMKMTLSCDHRVIDGAMAALFLQELKKVLENPAGLIL
jgi:pyruvate dehydrogenase E2 component (dihydrolipoamide acetyltransferase)